MPYGILEDGVLIAEFVVPLTFRSNKPVFATDALSLKRSTRQRSAQRWEIETRLDPKRGGANDLMVDLVTSGNHTLVQVLVPQNTGAVFARTSVSAPTATGALGASQITVAGNAGTIPKGTFIRFANHSKVYMLTTRLDGNGPVGVFPTLRSAVPAGTAFKFRDDVVMDCLYDLDTVQGQVYEDGILMDVGVVKLIEKL